MTEEWRQQLADWAGQWFEPGEALSAAVFCHEPQEPTVGDVAWALLSVGAPGGGLPRGPSKTQTQTRVLMATNQRVLVFPFRSDGLDPPIYSSALARATVRVRRGLFGSTLLFGVTNSAGQRGEIPFDLSPGTRKDALRVASETSQ